MKINLTHEQVGYLREALRRDIQTFYDDPCGWLDSDPEPADVLKEIDLLSGLARSLGLDYDHIVSVAVSAEEIAHMRGLARHGGVIPTEDDPEVSEAQ